MALTIQFYYVWLYASCVSFSLQLCHYPPPSTPRCWRLIWSSHASAIYSENAWIREREMVRPGPFKLKPPGTRLPLVLLRDWSIYARDLFPFKIINCEKRKKPYSKEYLSLCVRRGIINYSDTKAKKCCHLIKLNGTGTSRQVFIRVYRPEIQ